MRDYKKEYRDYHGKPKQRKERSSRAVARRLLKKRLGASKLAGKDVDHKDGNPRNNSLSNLRVMDKSRNRSKK